MIDENNVKKVYDEDIICYIYIIIIYVNVHVYV